MGMRVFVVLVAAFALGACQTFDRGVHNVPVTRDYGNLEPAKIKEATPIVEKAHRVGAERFAPHSYLTASGFLKNAKIEKAEGDRKATKDFSGLAMKMGNEAIQKGSGIPDKGPMAMPKDAAECRAEFDKLVARYKALDRCKAILVAPVQYAHIENALSAAEEELNEVNQYPQAARYMEKVDADIESILAYDADGDGIVDMKDGDPWVPEDKDGFQDEDGIPEPKPYPQLASLHFATNKAVLSADAMGYLRGIAVMMTQGCFKDATLYVAGHTDSQGGDKPNDDLSKRRSDAVQKYLTEHGVPAAKLSVSFHGETKPVAENTNEAGRAQNRRVDLKFDSPDVVSKYCMPTGK